MKEQHLKWFITEAFKNINDKFCFCIIIWLLGIFCILSDGLSIPSRTENTTWKELCHRNRIIWLITCLTCYLVHNSVLVLDIRPLWMLYHNIYFFVMWIDFFHSVSYKYIWASVRIFGYIYSLTRYQLYRYLVICEYCIWYALLIYSDLHKLLLWSILHLE